MSALYNHILGFLFSHNFCITKAMDTNNTHNMNLPTITPTGILRDVIKNDETHIALMTVNGIPTVIIRTRYT